MHSLCGKTEVTIQMPGNRSNGLDIYIRTVTQGHLLPLPFRRYYFQRLIFGFFGYGLLLLDVIGGSLGKGSVDNQESNVFIPQDGLCLTDALVWVGRLVSGPGTEKQAAPKHIPLFLPCNRLQIDLFFFFFWSFFVVFLVSWGHFSTSRLRDEKQHGAGGKYTSLFSTPVIFCVFQMPSKTTLRIIMPEFFWQSLAHTASIPFHITTALYISHFCITPCLEMGSCQSWTRLMLMHKMWVRGENYFSALRGGKVNLFLYCKAGMQRCAVFFFATAVYIVA